MNNSGYKIFGESNLNFNLKCMLFVYRGLHIKKLSVRKISVIQLDVLLVQGAKDGWDDYDSEEIRAYWAKDGWED